MSQSDAARPGDLPGVDVDLAMARAWVRASLNDSVNPSGGAFTSELCEAMAARVDAMTRARLLVRAADAYLAHELNANGHGIRGAGQVTDDFFAWLSEAGGATVVVESDLESKGDSHLDGSVAYVGERVERWWELGSGVEGAVDLLPTASYPLNAFVSTLAPWQLGLKAGKTLSWVEIERIVFSTKVLIAQVFDDEAYVVLFDDFRRPAIRSTRSGQEFVVNPRRKEFVVELCRANPGIAFLLDEHIRSWEFEEEINPTIFFGELIPWMEEQADLDGPAREVIEGVILSLDAMRKTGDPLLVEMVDYWFLEDLRYPGRVAEMLTEELKEAHGRLPGNHPYGATAQTRAPMPFPQRRSLARYLASDLDDPLAKRFRFEPLLFWGVTLFAVAILAMALTPKVPAAGWVIGYGVVLAAAGVVATKIYQVIRNRTTIHRDARELCTMFGDALPETIFAITDRWSVDGYLFCTENELVVVNRVEKRLSAERFAAVDIDGLWTRGWKRGRRFASDAAPIFAFKVSNSEGTDTFCMKQFASIRVWALPDGATRTRLFGGSPYAADEIEALVVRSSVESS